MAVDTNAWRRSGANGDHGRQGPRETWGEAHGSQVTWSTWDIQGTRCARKQRHKDHKSCDLREQKSANEALSSVSLEYVSWT